jgi:hypothetical protein
MRQEPSHRKIISNSMPKSAWNSGVLEWAAVLKKFGLGSEERTEIRFPAAEGL